MRTPEQRLTFQLDRLNVAQAAKDRAERKIVETQKKKTSALLYIKNNVIHADRAFSDSESKIQSLRLRLEQAEKESASLKEKACLARQEVESYGSRHDFALENAVAVRDDLESKRKSIESDYLEAFDLVEFNERKATEESRKNDPNYN